MVSKEKLLKRLYRTINESNKLQLAPPDHNSNIGAQFRFYIGKGNNFLLVRGILKQRWWWSHAEREDLDDCHFVWT